MRYCLPTSLAHDLRLSSEVMGYLVKVVPVSRLLLSLPLDLPIPRVVRILRLYPPSNKIVLIHL